jgi:hypothetical protein
MGVSAAELWSLNVHALRAAFLFDDEALRVRLIAEFEEFAARERLLATQLKQPAD